VHVVDLETTLGRLSGAPGRADSLTHLELVAARPARTAQWPEWLDPGVRDVFERSGVPEPWTHQREAADLAHGGRHVVISTGTASGKSLCYLLPALHAIETARGPKGQRGAAVLYLSPTKALAQDQLATLRGLGDRGLPDLRCATHDGDSTPELREWTRDHAEYVLTNPDMLHRSLLPGHARWSRFFASLRYVVVDECHHYRGVFGAHVAQVLRRLRRVAALYGAHPTFVLASATVAEPEVSAHRLTGLEVADVTDDGSPRGRLALALWEPPFVPGVGENGAPVRRSATS
jgi:DEAD/DEAH box helicase domain-containing protein